MQTYFPSTFGVSAFPFGMTNPFLTSCPTGYGQFPGAGNFNPWFGAFNGPTPVGSFGPINPGWNSPMSGWWNSPFNAWFNPFHVNPFNFGPTSFSAPWGSPIPAFWNTPSAWTNSLSPMFGSPITPWGYATPVPGFRNVNGTNGWTPNTINGFTPGMTNPMFNPQFNPFAATAYGATPTTAYPTSPMNGYATPGSPIGQTGSVPFPGAPMGTGSTLCREAA